MITKFIFTVGLPGCGKSTYIDNNFKNSYPLKAAMNVSYIDAHPEDFQDLIDSDNFILVSADEIKKSMSGYTDENPENVHEDSVQAARDIVLALSSSNNKFKVVMDGGGLNRHYTQSIIEKIKTDNPDSFIKCVFFDTPVDVCISRISTRARKVPMSAIYEKNLMISECLARYSKLADEYERVDYYTNQYIFLDMDGTIVSYRKGKLDEDGNTDFVNSQLFLNANPVKHLIDYVKANFDMSKVYIITAIANNIVLDEKLQWLDRHFPEFDKSHFMWVGNKQYKHVFLKHWALGQKIDTKDMTIIDDMHETLHKCTAIGMNAIHPSNVLALTDKYSTLG